MLWSVLKSFLDVILTYNEGKKMFIILDMNPSDQ